MRFPNDFIEIYVTINDIKITWRPRTGALYPAYLHGSDATIKDVVTSLWYRSDGKKGEGKICDAPNVTVSFRTRSSKFVENCWTRLSGKLRIVRKRRFWTPSMTVITLTSRQPSRRENPRRILSPNMAVFRGNAFNSAVPKMPSAKGRTTRSFAKVDWPPGWNVNDGLVASAMVFEQPINILLTIEMLLLLRLSSFSKRERPDHSVVNKRNERRFVWSHRLLPLTNQSSSARNPILRYN